MSIKKILRKAAELVVEIPEQPHDPVQDARTSEPVPSAPIHATKSVEQIIRDAPGPNLDEVSIPEDPQPITSAPLAPGGNFEFQSVYERAGLTPAPFTAEQAFDVINSLPQELPIEVRRSTVQATLQAMGKAMGVNTESVIADAGRKVAALAAYEDVLTHQADQYIDGLQSQISELQQQIATHEAEIKKTKDLLASAIGRCEQESDRLDDVLEFFTLDQGASRNAPSA
jgi:hypothetical protein